MLPACNRSPIDRVRSASGGAVGTVTSATTFVVFSSELRTGGGAFEYPGGDNQTLSFEDRSDPLSNRSIRYFWNGQPATSVPGLSGSDGSFAGFTMMHTISESQYAGTPGRNLSAYGYSKITFYARGVLSSSTSLKIEGADDPTMATPISCVTLSSEGSSFDECAKNGDAAGDRKTLNGSWQPYTLRIYSQSSLTSVKDFFKATFVYHFHLGSIPQPPGQGGTVYIDQIQYEQ